MKIQLGEKKRGWEKKREGGDDSEGDLWASAQLHSDPLKEDPHKWDIFNI